MLRLWPNFAKTVNAKRVLCGVPQCRRIIVHIIGIAATVLFIVSILDFSFSSQKNDYRTDVDLRYAVVIDAGSSGSRVFVYAWPPHTGNPKELLRIGALRGSDGVPKVKKIEPGLSSIADHPSRACNYMLPLLEYAAESVPEKHHRETPLYILATAGMRLLHSKQQTAILDDLKTGIPKKFNFSFTENSVEIITGKQEGVYQWIAVNYILGRFDHNLNGPMAVVDISNPSSDRPLLFRKQTLGIMDMGGASMQIAFEITSRVQLEHVQHTLEANIMDFNLGCLEHGIDHRYHTYVATYLGLGANEALDVYNEHLINSTDKKLSPRYVGQSAFYPILDPCRPLDLTERITRTVSITGLNDTAPVTFQIKGTGDYNQCRKNLLPVLLNLTGCPQNSCIFSHLPPDFTVIQFYSFSEFWYTMEDVLRIGGQYNFTILEKSAKNFCSTQWLKLKSWYDSHLYPLADLHRFKTQCFKSAWITTVLHEGLGFPYEYTNLRSSPNAINNNITHWTLGAVLYRTRYFPLGDIKRENKLLINKSGYFLPYSFYLNYLWLFVCFLLVSGAILLYLRRLQVFRTNHVVNLKTFSHSKANDLEMGFLTGRICYN